jgi:hypothetical protein
MLLVRGENLGTAAFSVQGTGVSVKKTKVSDNGHWAFVWLSSAKAGPQTIQVVARTKAGTAKAPFRLAARTKVTSQPRGVDLSDVLYLIMPDRFARRVQPRQQKSQKSAPSPRAGTAATLRESNSIWTIFSSSASPRSG